MRAARLQSSVITRIAYDEDSRVLDIWFHDSGRYCYFDVPGEVYEGLRTAPSAGHYFAEQIRGRYRFAIDPERRRFRPVDAD
jgi:hypothetical protein